MKRHNSKQSNNSSGTAGPDNRSSANPNGSLVNGVFQFGECLGRGAFGSVYKALDTTNGQLVAVKQIKINKSSRAEVSEILAEVDLLKRLNHTNIVAYGGFTRSTESFCIIMEYCENGSLLSIIKRLGKLTEMLTTRYIGQALEGLTYLHEQGVIHRDIKAANILTTKSGEVKLADFGVSSKLSEISQNSVVGSPYWMAPEIIELNGAGPSADIWSIGCTVIEMMDGNPPYHNYAPMSAMFHIVQDDHPPFPDNASHFSLDFLALCLHKDPNIRPTSMALSNHPWIRKNKPQPNRFDNANLNVPTAYSSDELGRNRSAPRSREHSSLQPKTESRLNNWMESGRESIPIQQPKLQTRVESWDDDFELELPTNPAGTQKDKSPEFSLTDNDENDDYSGDFLCGVGTLRITSNAPIIDSCVEINEDPFEQIVEETAGLAGASDMTEDSAMAELELLLASPDGTQAVDHSAKLIELFRKRDSLGNYLRKHHKILPMLETLEKLSPGDDRVVCLVRVINEMITSSVELQEMLCLIGGLPVILNFISSEGSQSLFRELLRFITSVTRSKQGIQCFLSCQGLARLSTLIEYLNPLKGDINACRMVVDSLLSILDIQERTTRNDLSRIIAKLGLVKRLSGLFPVFVAMGDLTEATKIVTALLDFSQADSFVQECVAEGFICIWDSRHNLHTSLLIPMIKCLKNLTMQATALPILEQSKIIEVATQLLAKNPSSDLQNQIMQSLFNLCRLCKPRLERAVRAGLTHSLNEVSKSSSQLRNFAIPLLCEVVYCSREALECCDKQAMISTFCNLLADRSWHVTALESLSYWHSMDQTFVEASLLSMAHSLSMCLTFNNSIEPLLGVLLRLVSQSQGQFRRALSLDKTFMERMIGPLQSEKVGVRLNALKILLVLESASPQNIKSSQMAAELNVMQGEDASVLVRELASRLIASRHASGEQ